MVPLVDLTNFRKAVESNTVDPLPDEAKAAVTQWKDAFKTIGFAHVTGHGVPEAVIQGAYDSAKEFFAQPPAKKRKCDQGKGYGFDGYTGQGVERVSATVSNPDGSKLAGANNARPPDRVESIVVKSLPCHPLPDGLPAYEEAVTAYYQAMVKVLRLIMQLTACALDLPISYFDKYYFKPGGFSAADTLGECSLRLAYYPAVDPQDAPPEGQLRYGEHTDYTGFTILWQDQNADGPQHGAENARPPQGGLQVRLPDGRWVDCPPSPGSFTINSGDLIQVWSNDEFLSGMHRVANPPPTSTDDRISLVFFTGPSHDTLIEALPTCSSDTRPSRYEKITSGEHLQRKLAASNK